MIRPVAGELIGKDRDVHLPAIRIGARGGIGGRDSVHRRAAHLRRAELRILPADLLEHRVYIGLQASIIGGRRELSLAALAVDADGLGPIHHVEAVRRGERQLELGVNESLALDHALPGIVPI